MLRSWLCECRGGLTATALGLVPAIGIGLMHRHNPVALIFDNLVPYVALALVLVAVLLLIAGSRWRGLLALVGGATVIPATVLALVPSSQLPVGGQADLEVISFNLHASNMTNGGRISGYLASSGADVVVAVESAPIVPFLDALARTYPYQAGCKGVGAKCGDVLILSRHRLDDVQLFALGDASRHQAIRANIAVGSNLVDLVAVHFLRTDHGSLQVGEIHNLGRLMAGIEGPAILAGDFNAAPWTKPMTAFLSRGKLNRAAIEPGTWPVMLGPLGVPIDHVFVKAPARFVALDALPESFGSNHRGLKAEIAIGDVP